VRNGGIAEVTPLNCEGQFKPFVYLNWRTGLPAAGASAIPAFVETTQEWSPRQRKSRPSAGLSCFHLACLRTSDPNRISELERQASTDEQPLKSGDGGSTFEGMDDARFDQIDARLGAIETEQRIHLRWTLTIDLALAGLIATSSAFLMTRVDRVEDRLYRLETSVNELPGKLSGSLAQINQTLFQAITASKQTSPQVILLPAPSPADPRLSPGNEPPH
jgi:hypothetical protein